MNKPTPGPWVIAPYNGEDIRFIVNEEDCVIADCWPYIDPYYRNANDRRYKCRKKPNEADARLIAAAPDLLEALQHSLEVFDFYVQHHAAKGHFEKAESNKAHADICRTAIAKATWEE